MIEWRHSGSIDISAGDTQVDDVPCVVKGVYINTTLSPHPVEIKDGSNEAFVVPSSATAGNAYDFSGDGVRYENSIEVIPDPAATGEIVVIFVRLEEPHAT